MLWGLKKLDKCHFKQAECNFCQKHLANVCFAAKWQKEGQQKQRHKSHAKAI